jgi:hypothetical protein
MTGLSKFAMFGLIFIFAASSLMIVEPAFAENSIPKSPAPEFTVQIIAHPYDVPPKTTTTIDQYTGKESTNTQPGYCVENKSIEITIKNPQFTPISVTKFSYWSEEQQKTCTVDCNYTAILYYAVRVKGHFGDDWKTPFSFSDFKAELDSRFTVRTIGPDYPEGAQLDFQVQAAIGYFLPEYRTTLLMGYDFYGSIGDWSATQTLTMSENGSTAATSTNSTTVTPTTPPPQSTPTPTPIPTPTVATAPTQNPTATPEQPPVQNGVILGVNWQQIAMVLALLVVVLLVAVSVLLRKKAAK